ncbi:MAG: Uma2 family endonuclease [Phycisphaeraceae bacterium]
MPTTTHKKMTADEFAQYAAENGRCELIDGEVIPLSPTGGLHGDCTGRLHYFLYRFVDERDLGRVLAAETGFRLDGTEGPTVRAPDIAFIAKARAGAINRKFIPIPPDLAVETLSPDDRAIEVGRKVQWWLDRGTRLVWVLDPENRTITAHTPGEKPVTFDAADTLTAGEVLPGFQLPLRELFR